MVEEPLTSDELDSALMCEPSTTASRLIMAFPHVTNDLRAGILFHHRVCVGRAVLNPSYAKEDVDADNACFRFMLDLIESFEHYCDEDDAATVEFAELGPDKSPAVFTRLASMTQCSHQLCHQVIVAYRMAQLAPAMTRAACCEAGYWWIVRRLLCREG